MNSLQKLRIDICSHSLICSNSKVALLPIRSFNNLFSSFSPFDTNSENKATSLTQEELTQINLLIPRLCSSNHLPEAIRLIDTALLTNPTPPLKSLSLSILIHSHTAEPDLTQPMSLLTRLKHNPRAHSSLLPITKSLMTSYFHKGRPKHAFKVFGWVLRPDSPCAPDSGFYAVAVNGFCHNGMVLEALKAVRAMVRANLVAEPELRSWVYRGLLKEARIREAQELNKALDLIHIDSEGFQESVKLLDRIIADWVV